MRSNTKREPAVVTPRPTDGDAKRVTTEAAPPYQPTDEQFEELDREAEGVDLMDVGIDVEEDVYDTDEASLRGSPWRPAFEEDDGGSVSPEELGEQFLRRAAQQERRTKADDTESGDDVDLLSDAVHDASLFDHNHDPLASEDLPEVIADETDADAHHRIRRVAVNKTQSERTDAASPADGSRQSRETAAPPSRQRTVDGETGAKASNHAVTTSRRSARRG